MDNLDPLDTRRRSRHFCTLGGADPRHSCKADDDLGDEDGGDHLGHDVDDAHDEKEEDGADVDSSQIGDPKLSCKSDAGEVYRQ